MDTAINFKTGENVTAWALELKDPLYQFPYEELWYADPNNIESYDKDKVKDITKIEVRYRKAAYEVINIKGTKYDMPPSFFILNKEALGINTVPESKEHKLAKHWIYNAAKQGTLQFVFSTVKRPFDYDNKIAMKDLKIDFQKIDIEVQVNAQKRRQRADVIIPLKEYHDMIGTGIVVEIQFSKQEDTERQERTINWALKGYSICWINLQDFDNVSDDFIQLKEDKLNIEIYGKIIKTYSEKREKDIRLQIQEMYRSSYEKIKEFETQTSNLKKELDNYSAQKIIETSESIKKLKESLSGREANLISSLSRVENNPLGETFQLYKNKLTDDFTKLETDATNSWKEKMLKLNYPFAMGVCPKCNHGIMSKGQTKTGKWRYSCSGYPSCSHTVWIN